MRPIVEDDLPGINALISAAEPVDRAGRLLPDGTSRWRPPTDLADALLIEAQGQVIGLGAIQQPVPEAAWDCELIVHPAHRRRGVGRRLWTGLQQRAQQRQINLIGLVLDDQPSGAAFVDALGLTWVGRWHEMIAPELPTHAPELPSGYSLRRATLADAPIFLEIFGATFAQHRFLLPPSLEQLHHWWSLIPDFDQTSGVVLLEQGGACVGIASVRKRPMYWSGQSIMAGHVGPLGVLREHRGRGLARALLLENARWARQNKLDYLSLNVDAINSGALALYESFGFKRSRDELWWRWNRSEDL